MKRILKKIRYIITWVALLLIPVQLACFIIRLKHEYSEALMCLPMILQLVIAIAIICISEFCNDVEQLDNAKYFIRGGHNVKRRNRRKHQEEFRENTTDYRRSVQVEENE